MVLGLAGFGGAVALVLVLAVARGPYGPTAPSAAAEVEEEERSGPRGRPAGAASAAPPSSSGAAPQPAASAAPELGAKEALATFRDRWRVRDAKGALAALEKLAALDADALKDGDVQSDVLGLTQQVSMMSKEETERVFTILTQKTGTYGIDVLLFLVTNKGGSDASKIAGVLLEDPKVLERGSRAMQVAYQLRSAPCPKKKEFFKEAAEVGDRRALSQLQILSKTYCGRASTCCYEKDGDLQAAEKAIEGRITR
jgi:hypothetical protein